MRPHCQLPGFSPVHASTPVSLRTAPAALLDRARRSNPVLSCLITALALCGAPHLASAQTTYSSSSGVSISGPTASGTSTLSVSGASGTVHTVTVQLNGVTSSDSTDGAGNDFSVKYTAFTLTSPDGTTFELLGCTGNGDDALSNATISISDSDGAAGAGSAWPSSGGNVKPSSYWLNSNGCTISVPSPLNGYAIPQSDGSATLGSTFDDATPNGTWTLGLINAEPSGFTENDPVSVASWSITLTFNIPASTTTSISSSLNPSYTTSPDNVPTFTATVTSYEGDVDAGTVTFTDTTANATLCSNVTVSDNAATCSPILTVQGAHSIEASYTNGEITFGNSSSTMTQLVEAHPTQSGDTWCNTGSITIPESAGVGSVYPSVIQVSGYPSGTTVANVQVELNGETGTIFGQHLLVAPNGQNLDFFDGAYDSSSSSSYDFTFYDSAGDYPDYPNETNNPVAGNYEASDDLETPNQDSFPNNTVEGIDGSIPQVPATINYGYNPLFPAERGPVTNTFENEIGGAPANGDWVLYTYENDAFNETIGGGWCIALTLNTGTATTTTVSSSLPEAHATQSVNLTASVIATGGSPVTSGGTVTFLDNGVVPSGNSSNVLDLSTTTGQATFASGATFYSELTATSPDTYTKVYEGEHNFTAEYSGTSTDNPSTSATFWQRFDNPTTVTWGGNASPNNYAFCNIGPVVTVTDSTGPFLPNPSIVSVTNLPGTVNTAGVTLNGLFANGPTASAMQSLLEGPTGAALDFFSNTGPSSGSSFTSGAYTFADSATTPVPDTAFSPGTYNPTAYGSSADTFNSSYYYTAPASFGYAEPHGSSTFTSTFGDSNGNGTWSLFFNLSSLEGQTGAANGWCLNLTENAPVASVSLPSTSTFSQGQQDASFTVDVENNGPGPSGDPTGGNNPLTLADSLPAGLTYANYSGTGWTCSGTSLLICTNDSSVAAGDSYPELTIDVNVSNSASAALTNSVTVSGAGFGLTSSNNDAITVQAGYTLTVSVNPTGGGTVSANPTNSPGMAAGQYLPATQVTLTANPLSGYEFTGWSPNSDLSSLTASTTTITMNSATESVTANFALLPVLVDFSASPSSGGTVTLTPTGGGSSIASGSYLPLGSTYSLVATPASGYYFTGWSGYYGTDVASPTSATTTLTVNGPENLVANFAPIPGYVVTVPTDDSGSANGANCPIGGPNGGNGNDCSLRDALAAATAAGAGNITFSSAVFATPTTITLGSTLSVPTLTTITGPTSGSGYTLANLVTVKGGNGYEVFNVASGAAGAALTNLNIASSSEENNNIVENAGSLSIAFSSITGPGDAGGTRGIYNDSTGTLNLNTSTITGNTISIEGSGNPETAYGSGVYVAGGTVNIVASTIEGNNAYAETCATLQCGENSAHGYGGGIYVAAGIVTISSSTISKNQVSADSQYGELGNYTSYGAGIDIGGGTVTINDSIVSGDSGASDVNGTYAGTGNLIGGTASLASLGNYGGPTQTMLPLPGSSAICAGIQSNLIGATDQRGEPNFNASYTGYIPEAACVDAGAVQTNYALSFTTSPPSTGTVFGTAMSPAPAVTLTESGTAFTASAESIGVTDLNSDLTTTPATALTSAGVATFSSLIFTGATTGDTLTASLALNPTATPAPTISSVSSSFSVGSPTEGVSIGTSPAGLSYSVGNSTYTTNQSQSLTVGTPVTLSTSTPQYLGGYEYAFSSWSAGSTTVSGGVATNTLTPTSSTTSDIATFTPTAALVNYSVSPAGAGTAGLCCPPGGGNQPSGAYLPLGGTYTLLADPEEGYIFAGWSGYYGTDVADPYVYQTGLIVNGPENIVANFVPFVTTENWTPLDPQTGPSARSFASAVYDPAGNGVLFFGGTNGANVLNDTWIWNGNQWATLNLPLSPPERSMAAMAWDSKNQNVVLYGGNAATTGDTPQEDTWIFSNNAWSLASPSTNPGPLDSAAIAFDSLNQNTVLFGGYDGAAVTAGTWIWDGSNWTSQNPTYSPPPRRGAAMAFDALHKQIVLFGGLDTNGNYQNDTWVWNGTTWTQLAPAYSPPGRSDAVMVFDSVHGYLVLTGGQSSGGALYDLWVWNGMNWTAQTPTITPTARYGAAGAFEQGNSPSQSTSANMGELVMLGGNNGTSNLSDLWIWSAPYFTGGATLPEAVYGQPYSYTLTPTGSTAPYTISQDGEPYAFSTLGLSMTNAGQITGTMEATPGQLVSIGLTITDALGQEVDMPVTIASVSSALAIAPTTLPGATEAANYSVQLSATGGLTPYTFSATGLPAGLSLNSSNQIVGQCTASASAVMLSVTDSGGATSSVGPLSVLCNPTPQITTTSLASGLVGTSYNQPITVTGGTPPIGYSATGLPPGLSIDPSDGVISGVPTTNGTYSSVDVTATDTWGAKATETYQIVINQQTVAVTVGTNVTGLSFTVDGTPYTTTQNFNWTPGSQHTISTTSPQPGTTGTQYAFSNWSGSPNISQTVAPTAAATYTAMFSTQYLLTTSANPTSGGSVSPASGSYYTAGTAVPISATANAGYVFSSWTGAVASSSSASTTVTMNAPETVKANFTTVPVASISPSSAVGINFGTLYLGSTVTKTVTITNVGQAAMTISNPLIAIVQGGDSDEFVAISLCPKSLAAGKSCTMTVTFIAGPFYNPQTATLMIYDNAAGSPQQVPLTATVIDPVAQFSPTSLSFGTEKTDSGSSTKSITVTSAGGTSLSITNVAISGADPKDFTETSNCIGTFNPKASCSISVTFKPAAKGSRKATLVVTDSAHNSPQSISLSGTGD